MTAPGTNQHKPRQTEREKARSGPGGGKAAADSVDRTPDPKTKSDDTTPAVSRDDEPRGAPTSDRFHTEQAHREAGDKA